LEGGAGTEQRGDEGRCDAQEMLAVVEQQECLSATEN
jgi:hypothetical protein